MSRLHYRLLEMIFCPLGLYLIAISVRLISGLPPDSDFIFGAVLAVFLLRAIDAHRAYWRVWPECDERDGGRDGR